MVTAQRLNELVKNIFVMYPESFPGRSETKISEAKLLKLAFAQYPKSLLTSHVAIVLGIVIRIEEDVVQMDIVTVLYH